MRSLFFRIFRFFLIVVLFLGLMIAALPSLLSTDWARKQMIATINRSISGKVTFEKLTLQWGNEQSIEEFSLSDDEGRPLLAIKKLSTKIPLLQLLKRKPLDNIEIKDLYAHLATDHQGKTNIQRGLEKDSDSPSFIPASEIIVSEVNAKVDLLSLDLPLSAQISGLTEQGNLKGSFAVNLSLSRSAWEGFKREGQHYFTRTEGKETHIEARVHHFPIELIEDLISLKHPRYSGKISSILGDRLDLELKQLPSLDSPAFEMKVNTPLIQANMQGKIKGNELPFFSLNIEKGPSSLHIKGSLSHLFNQNGGIENAENMSWEAECVGKELSSELLQKIFSFTSEQKTKLQTLLGDPFNASAKCRLQGLNGPLQTSIKGPLGSIQLEGKLNKGILTLDRPLECSIKMTPLFTQFFLIPHVPLFNSFIGAENPLLFTIDPEEFSCPLLPFQLERIKIKNATLTLGKLRFRNEGELNSILEMISPLSDEILTIWLTPLYLEQSKGILFVKRFDMLVAHTYALANWGSINLLTHQARFDLGLPAPTLQYAFGIKNLEDSFLLQIPLTSEKGKIEIDKKIALGRISSLVAQSHGGSKGKLLGSVLDLVLKDKEEKPYPRPTTQPFPWQGEFNPKPKQVDMPQESKNKPKKKKKKKGDNKNMKEMKEEATKILYLLHN